MALLRLILILVSCFIACFCFIPEYSFYKEYNQGGDSVTLRNSWTGAPAPIVIITEHKSRCYQGLWLACNATNFVGGCIAGFYRLRECFNNTVMPGVLSVRRGGPADSATRHISLYDQISYKGSSAEVSTARANLTSPPLSLYSTGWSNWTFFELADFEGRAVCYQSTREIHAVADLASVYPVTIKSVARGCSGAIDKYVLASSLENDSGGENSISD